MLSNSRFSAMRRCWFINSGIFGERFSRGGKGWKSYCELVHGRGKGGVAGVRVVIGKRGMQAELGEIAKEK